MKLKYENIPNGLTKNKMKKKKHKKTKKRKTAIFTS